MEQSFSFETVGFELFRVGKPNGITVLQFFCNVQCRCVDGHTTFNIIVVAFFHFLVVACKRLRYKWMNIIFGAKFFVSYRCWLFEKTGHKTSHSFFLKASSFFFTLIKNEKGVWNFFFLLFFDLLFQKFSPVFQLLFAL